MEGRFCLKRPHRRYVFYYIEGNYVLLFAKNWFNFFFFSPLNLGLSVCVLERGRGRWLVVGLIYYYGRFYKHLILFGKERFFCGLGSLIWAELFNKINTIHDKATCLKYILVSGNFLQNEILSIFKLIPFLVILFEDVLDLAWSPHDAWLATCSVDNTVRIWNALKFPGNSYMQTHFKKYSTNIGPHKCLLGCLWHKFLHCIVRFFLSKM